MKVNFWNKRSARVWDLGIHNQVDFNLQQTEVKLEIGSLNEQKYILCIYTDLSADQTPHHDATVKFVDVI